jgi:gluconolactonase
MHRSPPLSVAVTAILAGCASAPAPTGPLREISAGHRFTEGPATAPNGDVHFTDQPNDTILRWSAETGDVVVWRAPSGRANGMEFDGEGRLVACADGANALVRFEPDGTATTLVDAFDGRLLNGPNDLWIAPEGRIYVTDPWYRRSHWSEHPVERRRTAPRPEQPSEGVYLVELDATGATARVERILDDLAKPNGIVGSPDGRTLYVADIGAGRTYAYARRPDGRVGARRTLIDMGSDGMAVDGRGNVYLTGDGVTIVSPDGDVLGRIAIPEGWTSNVTFGGADRKTLVVTASERVYAIPMSVAGPP